MSMVSISVRVSAEDADFLAGLEIPGAATPSDKLRAIITEARRRHEGATDFIQALTVAEDLLGPARQKIRAAEHENQVHSELLATVYDWLPETLATATSLPGTSVGASRRRQSERGRQLQTIEQTLADRLFVLIEAVLRLGVTSRCPCYNPRVVADRLEPVVELVRVIDAARGTSTGASISGAAKKENEP